MSNSDDHLRDALREKAPLYQAALQQIEDADIDLSLLEDSLRLTPWQRLVENDRALGLVRMIEQARIRWDGTADQNS